MMVYTNKRILPRNKMNKFNNMNESKKLLWSEKIQTQKYMQHDSI